MSEHRIAKDGSPDPPDAVINGRFTVREVLGEGGLGVVYRLTDELHPDRLMALKTILRR
jgi:hypothetical protein